LSTDTGGDGDPTNAALATYDVITQYDDNRRGMYMLPTPLILMPGDVLIGVINRYQDGVSGLLDYPAATDRTASAGSCWGWWNTGC
jgi:hypothetical protein